MKEVKKVTSFWNERWVKLETKVPLERCRYEISDYGRIKSIRLKSGAEKIIKGSRNIGYKRLNIHLPEKQNQIVTIHRFVAEHFVPRKSDKHIYITHIDGNKDNNYYTNLQWMTQEELTQWQYDNGVFDQPKSKFVSKAKLTESRVRLARKWLKEGKTKKKVLAKRLGITESHLNNIEKRKCWDFID